MLSMIAIVHDAISHQLLDNLNYTAESSPGAAPYEDAVCSNGKAASNSQNMEYEPAVSYIFHSNPWISLSTFTTSSQKCVQSTFSNYTVVSLLLGIQAVFGVTKYLMHDVLGVLNQLMYLLRCQSQHI